MIRAGRPRGKRFKQIYIDSPNTVDVWHLIVNVSNCNLSIFLFLPPRPPIHAVLYILIIYYVIKATNRSLPLQMLPSKYLHFTPIQNVFSRFNIFSGLNMRFWLYHMYQPGRIGSLFQPKQTLSYNKFRTGSYENYNLKSRYLDKCIGMVEKGKGQRSNSRSI